MADASRDYSRTGYAEVIACWSALADDFRTFLLNPDIFELTLSAVWDWITSDGYQPGRRFSNLFGPLEGTPHDCMSCCGSRV